ncbi:hypothetical protein Dsin_026185 [Dipteronia sinensis]|uniref:DYW domain-containing protein n=1 Tax=Dipteronia sinensis TaxID=43782 RepID=A0AAD9ZXK0_9ROSI|nr:hypothetical protein Dsin_026185 [Dipteronia sinensis]
MQDKDVISWTSLVTGFAHNGSCEEALKYFCDMRIAGICPDQIVVASILSACAELTSVGVRATNRGHPRTADIYSKIDEMMLLIKEAGYVADIKFSLHDLDVEGKALGLAYHSEKLAVAFALLTVPGRSTNSHF